MKLITEKDGKYSNTLAAKNMRIELKHAFPGHKFSVRSKSFSMGNSVDVSWVDGPTEKEVEAIIGKYQYGHYNVMEDIHESISTDFHDKHGSTKFAHGSRSLSYDAELQVLQLISDKYGVSLGEMNITQEPSWCGKYIKAKYNYNLRVEARGEWLSTLVHQEGYKISFYKDTQEPTVEAATDSKIVEEVTVTENDDKNGVEIRFPGKPDREVLDRLKANGFRWHRKLKFWYAKRTPERMELANGLTGLVVEPNKPRTKPAKANRVDNRIKKFNKMADNLEKHIETKRSPMTQNPTPKRMREYNSRIKDADDLENTQSALRAMAGALESGTLPDILQGLKTKADIEPLVRTGYESNGYYDYHGTGHFSNETPEAVALQTLIESATTNDQREKQAELEKRKELEKLEDTVRFSNIPGFFPTPSPVIEKMVERARIKTGDRVFDPEAGKGDIADHVKANFDGVEVFVGEVNHTLRAILTAKGYNLISTDFMEYNNGQRFDKIIMNPPFEKGQDIDHIQHAQGLLAKNGCLVSVISEGPFFRSDKKSEAFRTWLDDVGGYTEKLDNKSFTGKDAFRQTGVSTRIVTIEA